MRLVPAPHLGQHGLVGEDLSKKQAAQETQMRNLRAHIQFLEAQVSYHRAEQAQLTRSLEKERQSAAEN